MSRKDGEYWQSIHEQRLVKGFLKRLCAKKAGELHNLSRNQLHTMMGLLTRTLSFKRTSVELVLVNIPKCDRCKQASETASLVLCDREALATLRFRHLGQPFMKPGDLEDMCVRRILLNT
jgi:hypothetical protein